MGMSASQARLLSITSRLTNNEFRAQTITNSKLRLATQSQEASQKYMDALASKKLVFGQYDANGGKTYTPLTANVLLSYGDLKNQYALVNTNGQILLSGSDIKTYMAANSDFNTYMTLNGVNLVTVDNEDYAEQLQTLLGADWATYLSGMDVTSVDDVVNACNGYLNRINSVAGEVSTIFSGTIPHNTADYNALVAEIVPKINDSTTGISDLKEIGGLLGGYVSTISNPPRYTIGDEPTWTEPTMPVAPDFASLVAAYNGQQCHSSVISSSGGDDVAHIEHNLAALIWGRNGLSNESDTITKSNGQISVKAVGVDPATYVSLSTFSFGDTESSSNLGSALNSFSDYNCVKDMKQSIIDLYCDTINFLDGFSPSSASGLASGRYVLTSTEPKLSSSDIHSRWDQMYTNLSGLQAQLNSEIASTFANYRNALYAEFETQHNNWQTSYVALCDKINKWKDGFSEIAQKVRDAIDALSNPTKEVPDEKDAKYQWYKNLWYRMGGGATVGNTNQLDKSNFVELDENLINNSEWLEFALEHGIVTLEQATFFEDGSPKYPDMGQYDWIDKAYTSAVDIVAQDDEVAIAIAEVKYKNTITEIENKDRKFDQDLKKLDTEHNALQTEYESIKEVVTKNVERSFKAFS